MKNKREMDGDSPLMDALLRERFSSSAEEDAKASEKIIAALKYPRQERAAARFSWSGVWKIAAAAAILLAPAAFYIGFKDKFSFGGSSADILHPFVLSDGGAAVSLDGGAAAPIKRAVKLSGSEKISAGAEKSAFVIFPDLSKAEIAAGGSLKLEPQTGETAPSRFGAKRASRFELGEGVFRIDTGSSPVSADFSLGKIRADRANFIVIVRPDYCFCEVSSGSVNLSFGEGGAETCSIAKGKSFTLRKQSGAAPVLSSGVSEDLRERITLAKNSLTDLRKYDNILAELVCRNTADICLNKNFKRKLINDLK